MRIEVAFTPALLAEPGRSVAVVIDALRATSSLVTMFGRGLDEALLVETVAEARGLAPSHPGWMLCGEEGGLPPEGFDYGNSPAEFDGLDLSRRRVVFATTNGTKALAQASACPLVLVGALLNVETVVGAALRQATADGLDLALVCAGSGGAQRFSLEDAFCAGALVDEIERRAEGRVALAGGAIAARRLYRSYRGSAEAAFRESDHGRSLIGLGLAPDVAFCAQRDRFAVAPRVERDGEGRLLARAG